MKKRIALLLAVVFSLALMLGACGSDPEKADYNGTTYDELKTAMQGYLYNVTVAMPAFLEQQGYSKEDLEDERTVKTLVQTYGVPEILIEPAISYMEAAKQYGECINFTYTGDGSGTDTDPDNIGFTVDKAGKTLTTGVKLVLQKKNSTREVDFQIVYNYNSMEVTGIMVDPVLSMGEKMSRAGMNTLISMLIVFSVLILISLIIYAFKIFPYLEAQKNAKQPPKPDEVYDLPFMPAGPRRGPDLMAESVVQPETEDETELVAVIAAAIAASSGMPASGFVVRSIKRR